MNKTLTDRLSAAFITAIFTTLMLGFLFLWLTTDTEEFSDNHIVTVDYDCRIALLKPAEFPIYVVDECRERFRFIKEQPKSSV